MTEAERIQSIKNNGGRHLQNFKEQNITYAMCLTAVELDGTAFYMVPEQFRTEEIYKLACKTYGSILHAVPNEYMSKEICEYAVSSDGLAVEYVPEKFKTREMFLLAARNNPLVMQKMPVEYLDAEFCIAVVEKYGNTAISSLPKTHKNGQFYVLLVEKKPDLLWYIPKTGHTAIVCKTAIKAMGYASTADAVKDNPSLLSQLHTSLYDYDTCYTFASSEFFDKATQGDSHGYNTDSDSEKGMLYLQQKYEDHYSLKHILRWEDVCLMVVGRLPETIRYISSKILTYEMCLIAVKKSHRAFYHVPDEFKTEEICLLAFEKEPHHLERFPKNLITYELCLAGVKRSGYLLREIPSEFVTYETCMEAVKRQGHILGDVPESLLDEEMCLIALQNMNGLGFGILKRIPERLRTYSVCLAAVQTDSGSFDYVPDEHKTYELCYAAVKKSSFGIENIPDEYFTEELCLALVAHSAVDFKIIPKNKLTEKVCLKAISHGSRYAGTVLEQIPREIVTQEMCDIAVAKSVWSLEWVPDEFVTKEMLVRVAAIAPGRLSDNFPERFRTKEFISELVEAFPGSKNYIERLLC